MRAAAWIEKNLATIIAALAAIYGGFITGQVTTGNRLSDHDKRLAALESRVQASAEYHNCATRHFDRLEAGDKSNAPCTLGGM